jgi:DNA-binding transcriptional MerR regulator
MKDDPEGLSIGDLARLTGLGPELLRAWERRYGALRPVRLPSGHRRYSSLDVERVLAISRAVAAGHRLGKIAGLELDELRACACEDADVAASEWLAAAIEAVRGTDPDRLQDYCSQARRHLDAARFGDSFVAPLMRRVGDLWQRQELSVAQEHVASMVLQGLLPMQPEPPQESPRGPILVVATPPGERHSLALWLVAATGRDCGWWPLLVGTDVPIADLATVVADKGALALAVSVTWLGDGQDPRAALATLRATLPESVYLLVGGEAARVAAAGLDPALTVVLSDLVELERWLRACPAPAAARG